MEGAAWSKNALVYRSPAGNVCECCHPSVAFGLRGWISGDGKTASVVWVGDDGRLRAARGGDLPVGNFPVVARVGGQGLAFWADDGGRIWSQRVP